MPLYEYQCQSCGNRTEVIQRLSEDPLTTCNDCGGDLRKLISAPAFQFKGTGWYVTDYANKGGGKDSDKGKDPGSGDSKTKDSKKSESKDSTGDGSSSKSSESGGGSKAEKVSKT